MVVGSLVVIVRKRDRTVLDFLVLTIRKVLILVSFVPVSDELGTIDS